jgi:hypothetical protein
LIGQPKPGTGVNQAASSFWRHMLQMNRSSGTVGMQAGRVALLILLLFGLLTLVYTYPLAFHVGNTIANYGDPLLNSWILAWDAHQLVLDPLRLFDANIFHPYRATLAYSEHLLGIAIPFAPIQWAGGNPILTHNLALLASFVLSGFGTYLLVRYLTGSCYAGLVAGVAFTFASYRLTSISQLQGLTSQWLPFTFLYLTRFFRRRSAHDVWLFGLFFTLQILSCTYYAFYTALAVGLYLVYQLTVYLAGRGFRRDWSLWPRLALTLLVVGALSAVVFSPYLTARQAVGERSATGQKGAALLDYISVSSHSIIGSLIPSLQAEPRRDGAFFPGFVPFGLAVAGIVVGFRRKIKPAEHRPHRGGERYFYLALAAIGVLLSLGTSLHLTSDGPALLSPMPYTLLLKWVPGFSAMRVPGRLVLLAAFGVSVLAGYGAGRLANSKRRGLTVGVSVVLLAELFIVLQPNRPIEVGGKVPEVYRWLNQLPSNKVLLELPSVASPGLWADRVSMERLATQQYFSAYHWHTTIMGYSGNWPPLFWESVDRVLHFPSTEALSFLRGMGVDYILLHRDQFEPQQWEAIEQRLPLFADQLTQMRSFDGDVVYELLAPELPNGGLHFELYLPERVKTGGEYTAYAEITNPTGKTYIRENAEPYTVVYRWRGTDGTDSGGTRTGYLPLSNPEGRSFIPITLPAPTANGELEVTLNLSDRPVKARTAVTLDSAPQEEALMPPGSAESHFFPADLNYANRIELMGVALDSASYRAGDSIALTSYWRKLTDEPVDDYVLTFTLIPEGDENLAFSDNIPLGTLAPWGRGETAAHHFLEQLPLDLPPGQYQVKVGVYDFTTGQFVPVKTEGGSPKWQAFQTPITVRSPDGETTFNVSFREGWSGGEKWGRWAEGTESHATWIAASPTAHVLTLKVFPFCVPVRRQKLRVEINGVELAAHEWQDCEAWTADVRIPDSVVQVGRNEIVLRSDYALRPVDVSNGQNQDPRPLSLGVTRLEVAPDAGK